MIEEDFASPWDVKLLNPINTNQKKKKIIYLAIHQIEKNPCRILRNPISVCFFSIILNVFFPTDILQHNSSIFLFMHLHPKGCVILFIAVSYCKLR